MLAFCAAIALASPPIWEGVKRESVPIRFRCVDDAGKPLAGVSIDANMSGARVGKNYTINQNQSAAGGVVVVQKPKTADDVRVWASAEGRAGVFRRWGPGDAVPAAFDMVLPKATTIGGRVTDETGHGIKGVRVEAQCTVPPNALAGGARFNTYLAYRTGAPETDADGRWELTNAPAPATRFSLRFSHPDYVSDARYGGLQGEQLVTTEQLRAGASVVMLKSGGRITGIVTGPDGSPVAGAVVSFHDDPYLTPGDWEVKTDAAGVYTLPTLPPGRHPITVVARGLQSEGRSLMLEPGSRFENFRLAAGKPLIVRVVDEAGQPVPNVTFGINKWRGSQSLYNHKHSNVMNNGVPNISNAAGVYKWSGAPADAVAFTVLARGFQRRKLDLTATGQEQKLVLRATPAVSGRVTDATTGKPVPKFRLVPVIDFGRDLLAVERYNGRDLTAGAYRQELERDDCDYRILIEAPGYRTAMSRAGLLKDRVTTADFQLEPAPPVAGRVLGPDGKPVQGAKVSLANRYEDLKFPDENGHNLFATTGADGMFSLPAQTGDLRALRRASVGERAGRPRPRPARGRLDPQTLGECPRRTLAGGQAIGEPAGVPPTARAATCSWCRPASASRFPAVDRRVGRVPVRPRPRRAFETLG